jgi:hypothetical protein
LLYGIEIKIVRKDNYMEAIKDIEIYNNGMRKSLLDKSFFIDKIEANVFVDYGCADGSMLQFIHSLFPEYKYIGYDISQEMINIAKNKSNKDLIFTTNWNQISNLIEKEIKPKVLILSSIIHEIYSYGNVEEFWNRVFNTDFDYIIIRDMMVSKECERLTEINDLIRVLNKADKSKLYEFENYWGSIKYNKNLIHYLLKYRYLASWDREVKENYLPLYVEDILALIPNDYDIIYNESFTLPYIKNKVLDDFGIEIKDNTHLKLILRKK